MAVLYGKHKIGILIFRPISQPNFREDWNKWNPNLRETVSRLVTYQKNLRLAKYRSNFWLTLASALGCRIHFRALNGNGFHNHLSICGKVVTSHFTPSAVSCVRLYLSYIVAHRMAAWTQVHHSRREASPSPEWSCHLTSSSLNLSNTSNKFSYDSCPNKDVGQ